MSNIFTEEDTFNRLKRIPFSEMREKIATIFVSCSITEYDEYRRLRAELLRKNGWTQKEYASQVGLTHD